MEKKEIRKLIFQQRKELSRESLIADSRLICEKIISSKEFREADCIYTYMDCKGEVSTRVLNQEAWRQGKGVAAPKVEGENLVFYYIDSYEDTKQGYFGICEPTNCKEAKSEKALIIIPGVAFDKKLHRIGYGKGFYDRYLNRHSLHPTIAVAFDFQVLEGIPSEEHDKIPEFLYTQSACYQRRNFV